MAYFDGEPQTSLKRPRRDEDAMRDEGRNHIDGDRDPRNRKASVAAASAGAQSNLNANSLNGRASPSNTELRPGHRNMVGSPLSNSPSNTELSPGARNMAGHPQSNSPSNTKLSTGDRKMAGNPLFNSPSMNHGTAESRFAAVIKSGVEVEHSRKALNAAQRTLEHQKFRCERLPAKSYTTVHESLKADLDAANKDLRDKDAALKTQESDLLISGSGFVSQLKDDILSSIISEVNAKFEARDGEIARLKQDNETKARDVTSLQDSAVKQNAQIESQSKQIEKQRAEIDQLTTRQAKAESDINRNFEQTKSDVLNITELTDVLNKSCARGEHLDEEVRRLESDFEKKLYAKDDEISKRIASFSALEQRFEGLEQSRLEDDDQNQSRVDGLRNEIEEIKRYNQEAVASVAARVKTVEQALPTKMTSEELRNHVRQLRTPSNTDPEVQHLSKHNPPQPKAERASLPTDSPLPQGLLQPQQHPEWQQWQQRPEQTGNSFHRSFSGQRSNHVSHQTNGFSPTNASHPGGQHPVNSDASLKHPGQRSNSEGAGFGFRNPNTPDHTQQRQYPAEMQIRGAYHHGLPPQLMQGRQQGVVLQRPSIEQQQPQSSAIVLVSQQEFNLHKEKMGGLVRELRQQGAHINSVEMAVNTHGTRLDDTSGRLSTEMSNVNRRLGDQSKGIALLTKSVAATQNFVNFRPED